MRKNISFILLYILFNVHASAQMRDTIASTTSLNNNKYASDSTLTYLFDFAKKSPFFMADYMPNNYNTLKVDYQYDRGKYIPVQGATQIRNITLFTEGKTMVEKFHVYGSFTYLKSTEDSTHWAHQTRLSSSAPYYFGSFGNNHYERSIYKFNAAINRNVFQHNLPITLQTDYRLGNHFSNNDPRGSLNDFQLNINPSIGYTFFSCLKIGAGYHYGYGHETVRVGYKNSSYFENIVSAAYTNYILTGYGGVKPFQTKNMLNYANHQTRQYASVYTDYHIDARSNVILTAKKGIEKQIFKRFFNDSVGYAQLVDYKIKTTDADLLWYLKATGYKMVIALNYRYDAAADFDYELAGNNYINDTETYGAKINITLDAKKGLKHNLFAGVQHFDNVKKDGNNAVEISYGRLNLDAGWGIKKDLDKAHSFGAAISAIYSFKTSGTFNAPLQNDNLFFKSIIYPDYQFNTSSNYGIIFNTDYSFPSYKGIQTAVKAGVTYIQRTGALAELNRTILNAPGKDRVSANVSLNFYF